MIDDNGMTPLGKIVTITIILIVLGVSAAMIFAGTDIGSDIKSWIHNSKMNEEQTVQTEEEKNS